MIKKLLILLILIIVLLIPFTLSYDLSDFPDFISKDTLIVVGDNVDVEDVKGAVAIAESLGICIPKKESPCPPGYSCIRPPSFNSSCGAFAMMASDIENISNQNIISVGGPCANNITAQIMNLPTTWPECATGFKEGVGRIIMYNKWNKTQIMVAGYYAEDTKKAADVVEKYEEFNLVGEEMVIEGEINNPILKRKGSKGKIYDWNIEVILCKECSPYKAENISQNELETIKDEFISNFEEGGVIFDKFRNNGFYVNVTNEVKDKIHSVNITGARIRTTYYHIIVNEEQQKEPLEDEDVYKCKEDRECISVSGGCCGCGGGGTATAINKDYLNYWNNKLKLECENISCVAVMSKHWTCFAKPKCVSNKCELVKN